jgi:hypothetical protein
MSTQVKCRINPKSWARNGHDLDGLTYGTRMISIVMEDLPPALREMVGKHYKNEYAGIPGHSDLSENIERYEEGPDGSSYGITLHIAGPTQQDLIAAWDEMQREIADAPVRGAEKTAARVAWERELAELAAKKAAEMDAQVLADFHAGRLLRRNNHGQVETIKP